MFKWDKSGVGSLFKRENLKRVTEKGFWLKTWSDDKLRWTCMLSGCDYLPAHKFNSKRSLKKAYSHLIQARSIDDVSIAFLVDETVKIP
jgi:hypothetical protein